MDKTLSQWTFYGNGNLSYMDSQRIFDSQIEVDLLELKNAFETLPLLM